MQWTSPCPTTIGGGSVVEENLYFSGPNSTEKHSYTFKTTCSRYNTPWNGFYFVWSNGTGSNKYLQILDDTGLTFACEITMIHKSRNASGKYYIDGRAEMSISVAS